MSIISSLTGGGNQVTKSSTVPWAAAQPYLKQVMGQGAALNKRGAGFKAPNFQTWAPMSAQTQGALGGMWNASQAPNALAGQSMDAIGGILGGATNDKYNQLYNDSSNQAFEQNVQNQSNHIADDVQRQFSGLGRVGSAADTGALVNQLGEYRTKAMSDNWNQNIANQRGILGDQTTGQLGAVAAAPGAYDQQFAPYRIQAQVGSAYDDLKQRQIQSHLDRFNTAQQAPWNRLNAFQGAVTGAGSGAKSTTDTVQGASNPFGGALGGALAGASVGSANGMTYGPLGALAGGLLGGISRL